jgi:outer membrane protein TolC
MRQDESNNLGPHGSAVSGLLAAAVFLSVALGLSGCQSPQQHREKADEVAADIIAAKQQEALDKTEAFSIERPSDILRRRLLAEQGLLFADESSLGTDSLEPIEHWPLNGEPSMVPSLDSQIEIEPNEPLKLTLNDALQIAARNNFEYQSRKEGVFQAALALDLARNDFRNIFRAQADSQAVTDTTGDDTVTTLDSGGSASVTRTLQNGLSFSGALAVDLFNLLTQGGASSLGLSGDASVSMPLLRGAGRHIVTEPLTQAERDVMYEIWEFERFKRTFAVGVAQDYFSVLRQMDSVANARDNYRSSIASARWSRRRADAGRIPEIEVDQAVQSELRARNNWISAQERVKRSLDSFKSSIGLPPDALIELDPNDLEQLRARSAEILEGMRLTAEREVAETSPPADAPVELVAASYEDAGPLEMDQRVAMELALDHRLDLRRAIGEVYDAQRAVVVRADALGTELALGGSADVSDNDDDGSLSFDGARYAAFLSLDLPIERTAERNAFRNSLIGLERATRSVQSLEDQIKLSIRNQLRTLLESRESVKIQAQSVVVAEKQVRSATLFVEAGRRQIRDLLDAQDNLLAAQNSLTSAVVSYRIAELEIQRDLGLLEVNEEGLWREYAPEEIDHDS